MHFVLIEIEWVQVGSRPLCPLPLSDLASEAENRHSPNPLRQALTRTALDLTGKVFKAPPGAFWFENGVYILSGSIYHRVLAKYIQQYAFTAGTTQCLIGIVWRRRSCGVTLHLGTSSPSWNMKPSLVSFTLNLPKPRPLNEDSSQVRHELKGVIKLFPNWEVMAFFRAATRSHIPWESQGLADMANSSRILVAASAANQSIQFDVRATKR